MGIANTQGEQTLAETEYCQLSTKACEQHGATVVLANDVIHPMQGSLISVQWPEIENATEALVLSLEGREMMMGVYQLKLNKTASGHFTGDLLLPFCVSNEMTWQGSIKPLIKPTQNSEHVTPINVSIRMLK